jgi:XRE family transcriptional regulator, thiamine biosynthesis regulator
MLPPEELMTGTFLPGIRHLVAIQLRSRGLSQTRISSLIGVTQASVSLYLSSDPERAYDLLSRFSVSHLTADRYSSLLADALQSDPVAGVRTLYGIWTGLLGAGSACAAHREAYPSLAECDFCIKEYGGRGAMSETISEVSEAVKLLEESPEFVSVMPEVSVNIACAVGEATTPSEVVAIPGRIVKVKDRAKAMLPPESGASTHMSRVLLLARNREADLRAVINLRYDERMALILRRFALRVITIGRHSNVGAGDPTAEALERKLRSSIGTFDALVDEGGSGIEPNVYLFAKSAREAARLAIRLARAYSAA